MKLAHALLVFFISTHAISQPDTIKTNVYFDTDVSTIRPDAQSTLDKLMQDIAQDSLIRIILSGHTDFRASNQYNQRLSVNRCQSVAGYFHQKGIASTVIRSTAFGEERPLQQGQSKTALQKNRCVEIQVIIDTEDALPKFLEIKEDSCEGDTTIYLANGTRLVFDKCEYLEKKDCIEFTEIFDPPSAVQHGLTTQDTKGNIMVSGGMVDFQLKKGCGETRLTHGCRILIPCAGVVQYGCDYFPDMPDLYNATENGWSQTNETLAITRIDGVEYFDFTMSTSGLKNIDKVVISNAETKFKGPRGYDLLQVRLISSCPFSIVKLNQIDEKRRNILKKRYLTCFFGRSKIEATLIDPQGDTLILPRQPLDDLDKRYWLSNSCGKSDEIEQRYLGILPQRKRSIYRKYVIHKDDLIPIESADTSELYNRHFTLY